MRRTATLFVREEMENIEALTGDRRDKSRYEVRNLQVQMELNPSSDVKNNKKGYYKHRGDKRKLG